MVIPPLSRAALVLTLIGAAFLPARAADPQPSASPSPSPAEVFHKDQRTVDITKDKVAYLIGYAHLDTQWRWDYPETIKTYLANTLHGNFALFEKYPNYVFNFSGSRRYELMKEYYPAEYAVLKKYVAAGRWFPCGSSVDEGDAIVPSLESMIRHVLYGNHYFRREFGVASDEFMLPDCFGFPASLPEVLSHCGIKGFSTQKLTWGSAVGIPFNTGVWTGPDGTGVIAAFNPGAYNAPLIADMSHDFQWLQRINETGSDSGAFVDFHYYGTGDRGGAPPENSVAWLERSLAGNGPVHVVTGRADAMFNAITPAQREKLPQYKGDLLLTNHSAGSLSSEAYMKRWNRKSELLADAAERAAVAATWLGGAPYPAAKLYSAWDVVLGSQMHDMLPGTSIPKAYEYCWNDFVLAQNEFAAVEKDSTGAVVYAMDTRAKGVPLIVYNPLSIERSDLVDADVVFPSAAPQAVRVTGPDGKDAPAQVESRAGNTAHIVFLAHAPSISFTCYDVQPADAVAPSTITVTGTSLENARYRVQLDTNGDIASIFDKLNAKELLSAPSRLAFELETPAQYPAWNMDWADRQKPPRAYVQGPANIRIAESGPAGVALETERDAEGSHFIQRIRLAADGEAVQVINQVDWRTPGSSLRATFPLTAANPLATYDDKVGVLTRGNYHDKQFEVPLHQWMDLTDASGSYGVSVLSDCKYGADKPADNMMRLTLLYTPAGTRGGYPDQSSQDFGRHDFTYAIAGHAGDWKQTPWQGSRLNQPLVAFQAAAHPGALGRTFALLGLSSDHVEIAAVKKAEDSGEIIVRLRELSGDVQRGVHLHAGGRIVAAHEVDGQERAIKPAEAASLNHGDLHFDMPAFGLRAFAIKLSPPGNPADAPKSLPITLPYNLAAASTSANRAAGAFGSDGSSYPAEQLPPVIASEGVPFKMGSLTDGAKNAVACKGQVIPLPTGDFNRVYLLAAAADGDASGTFGIGDTRVDQKVQDWSGYIGQWDNRVWKAAAPGATFDWNTATLIGLMPGFTKRDTVAWYASYRNHPTNGVEYYQYCYLFKYGWDLPRGAKTLTLPDNDKIRVFAITVSSDSNDAVAPAQPIYDTLADHLPDAPSFAPASGSYSDFTPVRIVPPLYWKEGCVHYTLDGSEPTTGSPVATGTVELDAPATVKAQMFFPDGRTGPVASAHYDIDDTTPPAVRSAVADFLRSEITVEFTKPVAASAVSDFRLDPPATITAANPGADERTVILTLAQPAPENASLTVTGVTDRSPKANRLASQTAQVANLKPVYTLDAITCDGTSSKVEEVPSLPAKAGDAWTINFFVRTAAQPDNHTVIAGFGEVRDATGIGRYLCKFDSGIHFWSSNRDCYTTTPLDAGAWQMLTATYDGQHIIVYKNAEKIGETDGVLSDDASTIHVAPLDPWEKKYRFKGEIRNFTIWPVALSQSALKQLVAALPK